MDKTLLKHKDKIIDMVNEKIRDIYSDVHHDGDEPILDADELHELYLCTKIMKALSKIRHTDHDMKMDFNGASGNTPLHSSVDQHTTTPLGYSKIAYPTM